MTHSVAIIGGGPAGLRAAEVLAQKGHNVTVYDHKPTVGRKFLMAGRGGLNLTHSEPLVDFVRKYGAAENLFTTALATFSPEDLRAWCNDLGFETFIGSSGRVFPKGMKASPLLRAWLKKLDQFGVSFALRHRWVGWVGDALAFENSDGQKITITHDAVLLALGGASWPRLGSDGHWSEILREQDIPLAPFRAANCGFIVPWSDTFRDRFSGQPLKPVVLSFARKKQRGEMIITQNGIEGGLVYVFGAVLRDAIEKQGQATVMLDLRPDLSVDDLTRRLTASRGSQSLSNHLRKAGGLSRIAASLLREGVRNLPQDAADLAAHIKAMPLTVTATGPLEKAISTAGGVCLEAIDNNMMLKNKRGVFVAGEMLDWEAPTGGYLLQGCFSTATLAAKGIEIWMKDAVSTI